ncbi:helix-turn-helix domain-containing protein [Dyella nitratireducens]|uniref:Transcriptional regulator n=1 Tax=Dyella nitratireducens TaxID=1849580 RepID=A0ABQ1FV86_9GAMM|nr:helix-turn-helix domain-containing protein [Dyella nitratireducens]GGA31379.1 transcriptional regulator [Dyella nitratireducens]GLQ42879.1 transcriptional regulator [Dyella nitratireducens]
MSGIFAFDSAAYDTDDAFARYCELYARGADVERTGTPFFARVRSWRLERTLLFAREYGGIRHRRGARVADDGFDHFVLNHVVSGELVGGPMGRAVPVAPGETLLTDTCQPMETAAERVCLITVSLARDATRAAAGDLSNLHGYCIGAHEGALLAAMLRALVEQAPRLSHGAHAAITRTLVDLLSVAINPFGSSARSEFYRLEHVRRETVGRLIEANLGTPDFSIQDIINATGISRAALYRLFESCGGVVRFLQLRRLQQLRDRLDDRAFDHRSLAELAPMLGFSSESHASRLFKQAFGIAPGAYRAASIRGTPHPTVELMARRWNSSLSELR